MDFKSSIRTTMVGTRCQDDTRIMGHVTCTIQRFFVCLFDRLCVFLVRPIGELEKTHHSESVTKGLEWPRR